MKFSFEYDPQKCARNRDKHGIDFAEAQALWLGEVIIVPAKVIDGEMRYANLGEIGDKYWRRLSAIAEQCAGLFRSTRRILSK